MPVQAGRPTSPPVPFPQPEEGIIPEVDVWAVLLATISTMVVGSIWYMPSLFGNRWMELAQVDPDQAAERGALPIVVTVIVSLVSAYVLAVLATITHDYFGGSFLGNKVLIGLIVWAGFTAARISPRCFRGSACTSRSPR